jgi:nitronate monooxygenase
MASLSSYLPWVTRPLVANAPMSGFAGGKLAAAVTLSRGLGMIGCMGNMAELREDLDFFTKAVKAADDFTIGETLPVGVGLLPFAMSLDLVLPVLAEYKPVVVWLFAAKQPDDYAGWARQIRAASPNTKIWIQIGGVAAAVSIAKAVQPDAICLQGADAGGHGFEKSAGIVAMFPEAADAFQREGLSIPLLASGGISDGRGVAAALAIGAQGVVVGTRFLASEEINIHPKYQAAILEARDGSSSTARSKLFDELRGPTIWPDGYDGRSLAMQSYVDYKNGVSIKEIRKLYSETTGGDDKGYDTGLRGRASIWAGSGVGLVNKVQPAAEIVESLRTEAKAALKMSLESLT